MSLEGSVERLNEHSLEDYLGWQRTTTIYIVDGWECWDCLGVNRIAVRCHETVEYSMRPSASAATMQLYSSQERASPTAPPDPGTYTVITSRLRSAVMKHAIRGHPESGDCTPDPAFTFVSACSNV
jgi:hypothetical protein